jgi:uncharacterized membrane protein
MPTTAAPIVQMVVRLAGLILIVLGILFWTGHADTLVGVHTIIGIVLVLSLWVLAALANQSGAPAGLVAAAVTWGLVTIILGLTQERLLTGNAHWVIQVVHLLVGLGAIGLAETLGARIRRARVPTPQPS